MSFPRPIVESCALRYLGITSILSRRSKELIEYLLVLKSLIYSGRKLVAEKIDSPEPFRFGHPSGKVRRRLHRIRTDGLHVTHHNLLEEGR